MRTDMSAAQFVQALAGKWRFRTLVTALSLVLPSSPFTRRLLCLLPEAVADLAASESARRTTFTGKSSVVGERA